MNKVLNKISWFFSKEGLKAFFYSFIWVAILGFALDLISKLVVANHFNFTTGSKIDLIPGFLAITYVENHNGVFGLGFGGGTIDQVLHIIVSIIGMALILFIYIWKYKKHSGFIKICLMLAFVGAIGNLVDRIFFSFSNYGVVDWIDFYGVWQFVFNFADSCIVVGVILLIIYLIVDEVRTNMRKERLQEKEETKKDE